MTTISSFGQHTCASAIEIVELWPEMLLFADSTNNLTFDDHISLQVKQNAKEGYYAKRLSILSKMEEGVHSIKISN